jgi:cytidine deaminase
VKEILDIVNVVVTIILHAVLQGKIANNRINILSIGINYYPIKNSNEQNKKTIHAECDAINKLPNVRKKQVINILVIRLSKNNKLGMSQPCNSCVKMLSNIPQKKGYNIKNIYYSDSNNNIIKTTLTKLQ